LKLAALALVFNAFAWGVSWWPFRQLQAQGLHPLWATAAVYALAVLAVTLLRPAAWRPVLTAPGLWLLVLASGITNAAFNWGVTSGDVVRVVLLFYLMPLWSALLAWRLLGERPTPGSLLSMALALAGAALVLWPDEGGFPWPQHSADWMGLVGGMGFACNNVLLRRLHRHGDAPRALAMFGGGSLVSALVALGLWWAAEVQLPPPLALGWVLGALALGAWLLLGNLALQYGVTRLAARTTALLMLLEIVFASGSAIALGAGRFAPALAWGGLLIVAGALLSIRDGAAAAPQTDRPGPE
jgi:drug/metabolite transporter (DMT)-like permease